MPAINFMKKFADAVENGDKCQTIRKARKNPIKSGDTLYLYTGQRTSAARKLKEARCTKVREIEIHDNFICLDDYCLSPFEADELAKKDGFDTRHGMIDFFDNQYTLPFKGVMIEWA